MTEQIRTPPISSNKSPQEQLQELRQYLFKTIQDINVALNDIDRRLDALEKGDKK